MHRIIGLDLGAHAVKAVAIEASFRSHLVKGVRVVPLPSLAPPPAPEGADNAESAENAEKPAPPTREARLKAALATLADEGFLKADVVVCAMPGAQVATQSMTFPYGDLKLVQKVLPGQLEDLELGDVVFDAQVVSRSASQTEMLVGLAREDDLAGLLALLAEAGVDPTVVTFSAAALGNLFAEGYAEADAELTALVDIGEEATQVVLSRAGEALLGRTLALGGRDVTRALAKGRGITPEAAEELKRTMPEGASDGTVGRALGPLVRELRATFAAAAGQAKGRVARIVLAGGGSRLVDVDAFLARSLGIPVQRLALAPDKAFSAPEEVPVAALALALALRGLGGHKSDKLNFRKGAFAAAAAAGSWRDRAGTLAAMAAVLVALLMASAYARLHALEAKEKGLDDTLCEATKKILGTCETNYRGALAKLKGKGSPAASVPAVSAIDLSVALGDLFPGGDEAVLTDLDIVDTTVSMRGDAKSYEAVDKLVESIQREKCFSEIKKGNLTKGRNDRIEFKLDALYGCGATKKAGT